MKTLTIEQEPNLGNPTIGQWHSIEVEGGTQTLGVRTFVPDIILDTKHIVIDPIAFSVHASKPRDVMRTSLIARNTGLVTVGLEMPGMGPGSSELTPAQKQALRKGDWSVLGEAQWDAIRTALDQREIDLSGTTVSLLGFSMGVSSAIGLIESAPDDVTVSDMIAWEGVAWQPRNKISQYLNIGGLMARMAFSGGKLGEYQKKLSPPIPRLFRDKLETEAQSRQKFPNKLASWVLPVVAMAKGKDTQKLHDALQRENTRDASVNIWFGEKSTVSTAKANKHAAKVLSLAGVSVNMESDVDGRHGVEDALFVSVPRYADALQP